MEGITNLEIVDFLTSQKNLQYFKGVYSSNNIPVKKLLLLNNFSIICNLSQVNEKGTHFITLIYKKFNNFSYILYLDSLSLNNVPEEIQNFITQLDVNRKFILSTALQSTLSDTCGIFCIFFVMLFDLPISDIKLVKYDAVLINNNEKCVRNIKKLVRYVINAR